MDRKIRVNVVTGQGGEGHYATFRAIKAAIERRNLPWQLQVTDIDELITQLSQQGQIQNVYERFGISGHDLYNAMVRGGWTWLWPLKMRLNKWLVKVNYEAGVKFFETYWRSQQPDLVVSVMPLYNRGLWESLHKALPGTPYVTVMTDFADCPPDFWLDAEAAHPVVCPTPQAVAQARQQGIALGRIVQTAGLVVHPDFCQTPSRQAAIAQKTAQGSLRVHVPEAIARARQGAGLAADKPTGLVMFGGNGAACMNAIARRLERLGADIQLIFLCGRDRELAASLKTYGGPQGRLVVEFTHQVAHYMGLADFFIGKPGNVSVSEAAAMGLPIITCCNHHTMAQERDCARWVETQSLGKVISSFKQVDKAVAQLLHPAIYNRCRENLARLNNQSVFEVVDLLQPLVAESTRRKASQAPPATPVF